MTNIKNITYLPDETITARVRYEEPQVKFDRLMINLEPRYLFTIKEGQITGLQLVTVDLVAPDR